MGAHIKRRGKNGKITHAWQVGIRNPLTGKVKYYNRTFQNLDGLTGVRLERAAISWGENWEKELIHGKAQPKLSTATFEEIADKYLEIYKSKWAESTYVRNYDVIKGEPQKGIAGLNKHFGSMRFVDIKAIDIEEYFANLNNAEYETVSAVIKEEAKEKLAAAMDENCIRQICGNPDFVNRPTLYLARRGQQIEWNTAKIICDRFGLNTNEIFDRRAVTRKYAKNTKQKPRRTLCAIFNWAIKMNIVETNFAGGTYTKGIFKPDLREKKKLLTDEEVANLFEVAETMPIRYALPLWLLGKLGISTAEFCGLNWSSVDFEKRELRIAQDRVLIRKKGVVDGATKNIYRTRTLPLDDKLIEKLTEARVEYEKHKASEPDFDLCGAVYYNWKHRRGKRDGTPANPQRINKILKKALFDAGVTNLISPHKLRHGVITKLIRNNVTDDKIVPIMGHRDAEMIRKVYTEYCKDMGEYRNALAKGY